MIGGNYVVLDVVNFTTRGVNSTTKVRSGGKKSVAQKAKKKDHRKENYKKKAYKETRTIEKTID